MNDELLPCCSSSALSIDSKHDKNIKIKNLALECVHAILYVKGIPKRRRYIEFAARLRLQAFQEFPGSITYVTLRELRGLGVSDHQRGASEVLSKR